MLTESIRRWLGLPFGKPALGPDDGSETANAHEGGSTDPLSECSEESLSKENLLVEFGVTPEQYILSRIRTSGGRLRQQEIVALLDWSEASVSRTLTEMEAEDAIVRVQFGREKVVYLPGTYPDPLDTSDATS